MAPPGAMALFFAALFLGAPRTVDGLEAYLARIPNGHSVMRNGVLNLQGIGHQGTSSRTNAFGKDFKNNGKRWTVALCRADSDGDGQSNGLELGDPDCVWQVGRTPSRTVDISHPSYADSMTGVGGGSAPSPAGVTTTAAPTSCAASSLQYGGVKYECSKSFDKLPGTTLHWIIKDKATGEVDFAYVKNGVTGWLSLGFPQAKGRMVGGHAVVAEGTNSKLWNMHRYDPPYNPLTPSTMRVPIASAGSGAQDGQLILTISGAKISDLTKVDLIFGYVSACGWPCIHSTDADYTLDLLTGASAADDGQRASDITFIVAFVALVSLLIFGPCMQYSRTRSRPSAFFVQPVIGRLTPLALLVFSLVVGLLVVVAISPLTEQVELRQVVRGLGLGAGAAALLPMLSITKIGVHTAFGLSRELAYHVHAFFGMLLLTFGIAHGIAALVDMGFDEMAEEGYLLVGLISLPTMLIAVPPGLAWVRYDWFKIVHSAAGLGYVLSFAHMVGLTLDKATMPRIVLTVANALALFYYVAQRAYIVFTTRAAKVTGMEVLLDADGTQHVALDLKLSGFTYTPGQWARLHIPRVGAVGHPFTIVPGDNPDKIRFVIKAAGRYTQRLAKADLKDRVIRVEGPYGEPGVIPALQYASAVAFVVGGVGVTPALALAPEVNRHGSPALVYWALRSERLFRFCAPSLGPHIDPALSHCQISTSGAQSALTKVQNAFPEPTGGFTPATKKKELVEWLGVAGSIAENRAKSKRQPASLYVFVCGPAKLGAGVRDAVKVLAKHRPDLEVQVHEETFSFLPH